MASLKQQLLLLVVGPLVLLSIIGSVITGIYVRDRAILALESKARSDLAMGEVILDLTYPGSWEVKDGILYKGGVKINNNFEVVDKIARLTGGTVTIFLGDTRVSTTVRGDNNERAVGTKVSPEVAEKVLKNGHIYVGEANVVGQRYQTAYKPIRDANGKIIGMFYVGISRKLSDELINKSFITLAAITATLTVLVALGAWFFAQKKIVGPLEKITLSTREVAAGRLSGKLEIGGSKEITDLVTAFNQMLEVLQGIAAHLSQTASVEERLVPFSPQIEETVPPQLRQEGLPKGLNEATLKQIIGFLKNKNQFVSAEEVGEGVKITSVTARRYLEYLDKTGMVEVEWKYGAVGRPVKLYRLK